MAPYHKYVFDEKNRKLIGDFEGMYRAEDAEGFDSWYSADVRSLQTKLSLTLLADYNFSSVLEIGCGKGTITQFLKRKNNRVMGIDISPTAIAKAKASFPDIEFRCLEGGRIGDLGERFDLVYIQTVLAYIPEWRNLLEQCAKLSKFCLVAEYVPTNAIGMVKSAADLIDCFSVHFSTEHKLLVDDDIVVVLGCSRCI